MQIKTVILAMLAASIVGATAAKADTIIGVAGPMSGSEAAFGEQFRRGAEKAVADINAKGGVLGQTLQLIVEDDACDPQQAHTAAEDLASRKAVFVAGHYCSGTSIPASEVYAKAGIVQISPGSTSPKLTERGLSNVFRVCGRDDAQGPTAAKYVIEHFKGKTVAILQDKSYAGKSLGDEFKKALNDGGVTEALYEAITPGEKDYSALISTLKNVKADIVYLGGYKTEGGLILRQMREQGLKTTLIGADSLVTEEFWAITGTAGEGTLMTFGPDARHDPKNAELVASFRAQNYEPEAYTLYTYAAIQAWAQAAQKAGSVEAPKVEVALRANQFNTVLGTIGFDSKGDITAPGYVVYMWKDGKYGYAK